MVKKNLTKTLQPYINRHATFRGGLRNRLHSLSKGMDVICFKVYSSEAEVVESSKGALGEAPSKSAHASAFRLTASGLGF